jgi:T5SS/PEP-CTERM-associated repeat protein
MWQSGYYQYIGYGGSGTLNISNGASAAASDVYIGYQSGSSGAVTVSGAGSTWTGYHTLTVGSTSSAAGSLNIAGGGAVTVGYSSTAGTVSIYSQSLLSIDVGRGSLLTVLGGSGNLTNNGKVRILAGAGLPPGSTWSPIFAGTWGGTGTYQAVGGMWSTSTRQFTVSDVQPGSAGVPVTIDLAQKQRILVSDAATGWALGESFLATTSSSTLTCTATAISGGTLTVLGGLVPADDTVLSGWNVSAASGYASGDPIYLSFGVGPAQLTDDLQVWSYSGSTWSKYAAMDLTYDRAYASLTVTSMGTYAISGDLVLMGDANRDGTTNAADLNTVLTNYNQSGATWATGDFDGNGTVNGADLNIALSNYNQTLHVGQVANLSPGAPVSEPAALPLLLAALAALALSARNRRS